LVLQVLQHRRIRQTPGTFAIAPFGRLLRPAVTYGDGYSNPPIPGDTVNINMRVRDPLIRTPENPKKIDAVGGFHTDRHRR
jgi:hypothetical protein